MPARYRRLAQHLQALDLPMPLTSHAMVRVRFLQQNGALYCATSSTSCLRTRERAATATSELAR